MRQSPINRFRPSLERLEAKQLLSASPPTTHVLNAAVASNAASSDSTATSGAASVGFLVYRITNPSPFNGYLIPPFPQVLVQNAQPIPGQVYNVLYVTVRNGTAQTFDSSAGFLVRAPNGPSFPILTGSQQWKPGQVFVFYVLTKQYYPFRPVGGGFQLDLGGRSSTLVPGPSGIFLRLTYDPAKIARQLNQIVAFGQGAQGGRGPKLGLPDTAINEFVSAKTRRRDFAGHF
jgi:hypothetical protein